MNDWIGLGVILLALIVGLFSLSRAGAPPVRITQEEFDRRAQEGRGLLSAGAIGLQKILDPAAEKAAAVQEDFRQGYLDGEQESGEGGDDAGPAPKDSDSSGKEGKDA